MSIDRAARPAFLALSCVGLISSAPLCAQAAPDSGSSEQGAELGTVTVTDTAIADQGYKAEPADVKRVRPLVDTPQSIVVIPQQLIRDSGSTTLVEALRTVPGITFGAAEGGNPIGDRPFIRGYDTQGSTYIDNVRDVGAQSRETFAVEQIQVVRGSDSTLGGRGSAGGAINIISKMPTSENMVAGSLSAGLDDYKRATLDVNRKLSDMVGVRLNAMWHDQDVAGRDKLWQKRWGVAPSLTIGLDGPTRLTVMHYHLETDELPDSGFGYRYIASSSASNAPTTGLVYSEPAVGKFTTASGQTGTISRDTFYGLTARDFRDTNIDQSTARVEHDFGGVTLRNTTRYGSTKQAYIYTQPDDSQGDIFGFPTGSRNVGTLTGGVFNAYTAGGRVWRRANTRWSDTETLINQTDLFGKLNTGAIEHSFAMGAEFSSERSERGTLTSPNGAALATGTSNAATGGRCGTAPGTAPYNCADLFNPNPDDPWVNLVNGTAAPIVRSPEGTSTINHADTRAAYAFDSIAIGKSIIANLGVRYDRYHSRVDLPTINGVRPEVERTDGIWNYTGGLIFKPTAETSVYASYQTASTPPNALLGEGAEGNGLTTVTTPTGSQTLDQAQAIAQAATDALKPERTKSYEVGAKASLLGDQLSLSLALFKTNTNNARVTSDQNTVAFVGKRRVKGVEFSVSGNVTPEWNIFGGYTYLDAKIVDGGYTAFTLPAGGGVPARVVLQESVNTGKRFPQTPKHAFTAWTTYSFTPAFSLGGGAIYQSRMFGGYSDNRYVSGTGAAAQVVPATVVIARTVPGYWRFDATADYKISDAVDLRLNVQNLTNKRYFQNAYTAHYAQLAPGRTAFLTLSFKY